MNRILHAAVACLLLCATASQAYALGGWLEQPSISIGDATDRQLFQVLNHEKFQFVGGFFINWNTTLAYAGNADNLNAFLEKLAKIDSINVAVRFSKHPGGIANPFPLPEKEADVRPCQWKIEHWAGMKKVTVEIFVGEGAIDVEQLRLPEIKAAPDAD